MIFYHPTLIVEKNGVSAGINIQKKEEFSKICTQTGIVFVDMTDDFLKQYEEKAVFPHGFTNTRVETGHLNRHGHEIIAKKLFEFVSTGEER